MKVIGTCKLLFCTTRACCTTVQCTQTLSQFIFIPSSRSRRTMTSLHVFLLERDHTYMTLAQKLRFSTPSLPNPHPSPPSRDMRMAPNRGVSQKFCLLL